MPSQLEDDGFYGVYKRQHTCCCHEPQCHEKNDPARGAEKNTPRRKQQHQLNLSIVTMEPN
jgi:hypothetical protein